jgi:hypothetical protein
VWIESTKQEKKATIGEGSAGGMGSSSFDVELGFNG